MINDNFWQDRPTLVTGATGFLGSWLVRRLLDNHAEVVCLVRGWIPQSDFVSNSLIDGIKVIPGDIQDQALLEEVLLEHEINTVFHLAAQTIVQVANQNPLSTFATNIAGTWSILEACRRNRNVKQIIVASSDKAYGAQGENYYHENTPLQGKHPYDVSKSCTDLIAQSYAHTYELPIAITRCGNFYGGGDLHWNRLVPGTIRSIIRGQKPQIRSNGQYVRDYFYIEDASAAYLLLAEKLAADKTLYGQAFNFANEKPLTVLELVSSILQIMGSSLTPSILNEACCEITYQCLNTAKAQEVLGWRSQYPLEEGLKRTVSWYLEYFERKESHTLPKTLPIPKKKSTISQPYKLFLAK